MIRGRARPVGAVAVLSCLLLGPGGSGRDEADLQRWNLPRRLKEISGLALTRDGRLLAHEDQLAIVYELDAREMRLRKAFALGRPTLRGDFEGIAVAGDRIYLVTSGGMIYETEEGADGERVAYQRFEAAVGDSCAEVEGLDYDPADGVLLLPCKQPSRNADRGQVLIHRWSPARRAAADPAWIRVSAAALAVPPRGERFRPTAIAVHPVTGHLLLLSSRPAALAELRRDGSVVALRALSAAQHRQPEGLAVGAAGEIYVADEGASRPAQLARYANAPR